MSAAADAPQCCRHEPRGGVVVPDDLVEAADPEQRPGLTADVAERPVQLRGTLEQRQRIGEATLDSARWFLENGYVPRIGGPPSAGACPGPRIFSSALM